MTNPYAFVPFGDDPPVRVKPTWHSELLDGCLSGTIVVDITVLTPVMIGEAVEGEAPPRRIGEVDQAATIVPGSTIAGSIRSVHEALTNSCLRVLDLNYVPVHRQFMSRGVTSGLRMALVVASDKGLPTRVRLMDKNPLRVDADAFPATDGRRYSTDDPGPGIAYSGMRLSLAPEVIRAARTRARERDEAKREALEASGSTGNVFPSPIGLERPDLPDGDLLREDKDGEWVLYVSDTRARSSDRVWFRAAKIPSDPVELVVGSEVRRSLARAIEGAFDMHRFREEEIGDFLNVYTPADAQAAVGDVHRGPVIGRRRRIHKRMFESPGVPVWVVLSDDDTRPDSKRRVTEIRLAQAWRIVGDGEMPTRAQAWAPCRKPSRLCPSCAVFGSAGEDEADPGRGARQNSYRGHVRISDAAHDDDRVAQLEAFATYRPPTLSEEFSRRPLGSPKPTAGQFYLTSGSHAGRTDRSQPLAQWGSPADGDRDGSGRLTQPRPLAGRKFYWATTSVEAPDKGRGSRGDGDAEAMVDRVRVVLPGSGFTARITVDNLTRAQIGGLLAAIDTRLLGPGWESTVGRIGGGRPFGWGAVALRVDPESLDLRGPTRYTDERRQEVSVEGLVEDFLAESPGVAAPSTASPIRHLQRILTLDAVNDSHVAYPVVGAQGDPFAFWKGSSGSAVTEKGHLDLRRLGRPPMPLDVAPDVTT